MSDNEAQFTAEASASLEQLKSNIDSQYSLGGPAIYSTEFPLSSDGVPILAQPTQAELILLPTSCPNGFYTNSTTSSSYGLPNVVSACVFEREAFSTGTVGSKTYTNPMNLTTATALMEMLLPNRYFPQQTFFYEDDAIIQSQGGGHSTIIGPPPFTITKSGSNISVTASYVELYGNSTVVIGQGAEEVYSQLVTDQVIPSNGFYPSQTFNFTFQIGTRNPCAWFYYLTNLTAASGLAKSSWSLSWAATSSSSSTTPPTSSVCLGVTGVTYLVTFRVINITYASVTASSLVISLGVGVA
jgi:hypothetical protein